MRHGSRSKFKEEMNYGSTAQYDRSKCEQNVRRYNKRTGKIFMHGMMLRFRCSGMLQVFRKTVP